HREVGSGGCDSVFTLSVSVFPINGSVFYDTICQYDDYQLHGFSLTNEETAHPGDFDFQQHLQNVYGCDSTVIVHMVIYSNPRIDFVSNPERVMLTEGASVEFINLTDLSESYPGERFIWHWDFGDGNSETSEELAMSHSFDTWGEFLVTLSLQSDYGCSSSTSHYVYVDADLEFPNIITPNGDGVNDVFAIKNLNPLLDNILTIYDRWGKRVYEKKNYQTYIKDGILYNPEMGFTGENFSDGVYFYTFHYVGFVRAVDYHSSLTIIR
ncbi:MAG: gliding motility-associated C-terminal domain-containing protein, partial [Bacteroidales bacterium]|nr:gliding motility-associated C-terminal domain-containing protein [Bacteroidales bacterium]